MLSNEIIIYNFNDDEIVRNLRQIMKVFSNLWKNIDFVIMNQKQWMRIFLKFDWKTHINDKIKMYFLKTRDRKLIDNIFDELHVIEKLSWIIESTFFNYLLFCVWKTDVNEKKKKRVIIDIRNLNVIIQSNVYLLSLQSNIIWLITNCEYIIVINVTFFFYQWRVHSDNKHKFIVVSHRDQKSFNMIIINYKNSSTYVQRQINHILRKHRNYARVYVNDIIIFFKFLQKHVIHLTEVFDILNANNIIIKFEKAFLNYFIVQLLN